MLLDGISSSIDMNLSKLWKMVKDREAWRSSVQVLLPLCYPAGLAVTAAGHAPLSPTSPMPALSPWWVGRTRPFDLQHTTD